MVSEYLALFGTAFAGSFMAIFIWIAIYEELVSKPRRERKALNAIEAPQIGAKSHQLEHSDYAAFGPPSVSDEKLLKAFSEQFVLECVVDTKPIGETIGISSPVADNSMNFVLSYKIYGRQLNQLVGWDTDNGKYIKGSLYVNVANEVTASLQLAVDNEGDQFTAVAWVSVSLSLPVDRWLALREEIYRYIRDERSAPKLKMKSSTEGCDLSKDDTYGWIMRSSLIGIQLTN
jgi:hypothetical protein